MRTKYKFLKRSSTQGFEFYEWYKVTPDYLAAPVEMCYRYVDTFWSNNDES